MNVTRKAWSTWNEICCRWFDYDAMSYVSTKAYDIHSEIDSILRGYKPWELSA